MKLSQLFCIGVFAASSLTGARAATVLYHRYDGDAGASDGVTATAISDSSGAPLNPSSSITGTPTYSSNVFGTPIPQTGASNALSLDLERSATDYYSVADAASLDFAGGSAFTIEGWVRLETLANTDGTTRQMLALKKSGSNSDNALNYGFMVQRGTNGAGTSGITTGSDANSLGLLLGNGTSWSGYYSTLKITDTNWHYVSVRFDDTTNTATFNLDGASQTLSGTVTQSIAANSLDLTVGAHMNSSGVIDFSFDGRIDELRISNTFLADNELLNAVPEPSAAALLGLGLLGFLARRRRA